MQQAGEEAVPICVWVGHPQEAADANVDTSSLNLFITLELRNADWDWGKFSHRPRVCRMRYYIVLHSVPGFAFLFVFINLSCKYKQHVLK